MIFYKTSLPNPVLFTPPLPQMDSPYVVLGGVFATFHRKLYAGELRELDVRQRRIAGPGTHVNWNEPWHDVCFLSDPVFFAGGVFGRLFSTLPKQARWNISAQIPLLIMESSQKNPS